MAVTPQEIEQVLEQMREVLLRWHNADRLGEVAILRGGQEWLIEERPRERHPPVKREHRRMGYLEKVTK